MPDRLVPVLRAVFLSLAMVYVALIISTVSYASVETNLRANIHTTEAKIAVLEHQYLTSVEAVALTDPQTLGLVTPLKKQYAKESASAPTLSLLYP